MSSIVEKLRARVSSIKEENKNAARSSSVPSSNDNTLNTSVSRTGISLYGVGREQCVANLKIAVALNIYGRKVTYPDYMRAGFAVCAALISPTDVQRWFSSYCIEPYPNVCVCGELFMGNAGCLRTHCAHCKGSISARKLEPYTLQRLARETGIHYSWLEYAASWALAGFNHWNLPEYRRYLECPPPISPC